MKKYSFVFCFMMVFAILFCGVSFNSQKSVLAEEETVIEISNLSDLNGIKDNLQASYRLANNISLLGSEEFSTVQGVFSGTFDGNGYTISGLKISSANAKTSGIFEQLSSATIKNLQLKNISVSLLQESENDYAKAGILAGKITQGTKIENVSIDSCSLLVNSKSTTYTGLIAGEINDGSTIKNCFINGNITTINTSDKTNEIGGLFGRFEHSKINFVVQNIAITLNNITSSTNYLGGISGVVLGSETDTSIKSVVSLATNNGVENITLNNCENVIAYSLFGKIEQSEIIKNLNFIHTTSNLDYAGNFQTELLANKVGKLSEQDTKVKAVYQDAQNTKFDEENAWNFVSIWQFEDERNTLPSLQHFSTFSFSVNESKSFSDNKKPSIDNVISITSNDNNEYRYSETLFISGKITPIKNMDKFFKIIGLKFNDKLIFDNQLVLTAIENATSETTTENTTKYEYESYVVTKTMNNEVSNIFQYTINAYSGIVWEHNDDLGTDVYYIKNANLSNSGEYTFNLEYLQYEINVFSENVEQGTIKNNYQSEKILSYGDKKTFSTVAQSDFTFKAWYRDKEKEVLLSDSNDFTFTFNETLFETGGYFEGLALGEDELTLMATFTKYVCDVQIKFAVNDKIVDDILSQVKCDDTTIQAQDGKLIKKLGMGKTYKFSVVVPAGYEFDRWFESSDANTIGGNIGSTLEVEVSIQNDTESMIIVVNLKQEVKEENNDTTWIWVVVGIGGGTLILGLVIFFVVRSKRNRFGGGSGKNDYKKMFF